MRRLRRSEGSFLLILFAVMSCLGAPAGDLWAGDDRGDPVTLGGGPLELVWKSDAGRAIVETPILVPGGLLAVTTDRKIHRYELETGKRLWKRRFKEEIGVSPVYAVLPSGEDRVFVFTGRGQRGRLRALSGEKGKDIWTRSALNRPTSMVWTEEALWVLDVSGRLSRVDPEDGRTTWSRDDLGWDPPQLLADDERVYVLSRRDSLRAVFSSPTATEEESDTVEITEAWSVGLPGWFSGSPAFVGEQILVCSTDGLLTKVDRETGEVRATESRRGEQIFAALETGEGIVSVTSDGYAESVRSDSSWSLDIDAAVSAQPVRADPVVLIPTSPGGVVALNAGTGALAWTLELDDRMSVSPVLTPRFLVLATNRGDIFVYDHR